MDSGPLPSCIERESDWENEVLSQPPPLHDASRIVDGGALEEASASWALSEEFPLVVVCWQLCALEMCEVFEFHPSTSCVGVCMVCVRQYWPRSYCCG
jgi:hypothetical protein